MFRFMVCVMVLEGTFNKIDIRCLHAFVREWLASRHLPVTVAPHCGLVVQCH